MNQYLLMMRGDHAAFNALDDQTRKELMERYYAYVQRLKDEGRFKGGAALSDKARVLRPGAGTVIVTDGPFAEAAEALNGYFVFEAADLEEAVRIGRDCPCLTHGETAEIIEMTRH